MEREKNINCKMCTETNIAVTPSVEIGNIQSYCIGKPKMEKCINGTNECSYMVNQMLCVRFPLTFSAQATTATKNTIHNQNNRHCQKGLSALYLRRRRNMIRILFCVIPFCFGIKLGL